MLDGLNFSVTLKPFEFEQVVRRSLGIHLLIRIFIHLTTFNIHGMLMILMDLMTGPWCLMSLMAPSHPASDAKPRAWQGRLWTNNDQRADRHNWPTTWNSSRKNVAVVISMIPTCLSVSLRSLNWLSVTGSFIYSSNFSILGLPRKAGCFDLKCTQASLDLRVRMANP